MNHRNKFLGPVEIDVLHFPVVHWQIESRDPSEITSRLNLDLVVLSRFKDENISYFDS